MNLIVRREIKKYLLILIRSYKSGIFKEENLGKRPLSRYTARALQNRHLEVLVTLLMLKIEEEQEEYRKLMRLAEELCIEDDASSSDKEEMKDSVEDCEIFKRESGALSGVDSEEILNLKALCHVRKDEILSNDY